MDKKQVKNLQAQGTSDNPGFGARGVVVPDPAVSSSCDGPKKTSFVRKDLDNKIANRLFLGDLSSTRIFEDTRSALASLEELSMQASRRAQCIIETISESTRELYLLAVRMELARDYLLDRIEAQGSRIRDLDVEIRTLKLLLSTGRESPIPRINDDSWGILRNIQDVSGSLERETSSRLSFSIIRSPDVIRGDGAESDGGISALSVLEGTISAVASGLRMEEVRTDEILAAEISQREDAVALMMKEIVMTTATVVDLDRIHGRRSDETGLTIDDLGKLPDKDYWVGRTHKRGEASRPRGRPPRIINQAYTEIMTDKENMELLPGFRSLGDRRTSPTVPGASMSSSCKGLTPRLSMGGEDDAVTVGEICDNDMDREDPLSLPLAFVECSTETNVRLEEENQREILQTPRAKRKARLSPGVTALSEGDLEADSEKEEANKTMLRKRIDRKKKAKIGTDTSIGLTDEVVL